MLADPQCLGNPADLQHRARAHPVFRIRRVATEDTDFSGIRLHQSKQQFHRCGFTRPVRP